jgi:4,5-dihydroxyphthalate decarboxylase
LSPIQITVACQSYDRIRPLMDGRVGIEGCSTTVLPMKPDETFFRAFGNAEFEVSELSASSYVMTVARGSDFPYVAVPVFPSRMYRHSAIYVRSDGSVKKPKDLRGKRVGIPEYQMTVGLWVRGFLSDIYGVRAEDMKWRTGGLETSGRQEKHPLSLPSNFDIQPIPDGTNLSRMLVDGGIDALISAIRPSCYGAAQDVVRFFPDYRKAEEEYFRQTGIFPIMHLLGVRKDMVERYPWLPASVFKAFEQARAMCMTDMEEFGTLNVALPWLMSEIETTKELMGENYWSYGIEPNRKTLETMIRYSHEQGQIARLVSVNELFATGTRKQVKV